MKKVNESKLHILSTWLFSMGEHFAKMLANIFSHVRNFHDTTPISFIKAYGIYFRVVVIFLQEGKSQKNAKITPM